jgi:hypothetical protein
MTQEGIKGSTENVLVTLPPLKQQPVSELSHFLKKDSCCHFTVCIKVMNWRLSSQKLTEECNLGTVNMFDKTAPQPIIS